MVPYLNQKGTDTEGLSLILHLCMLCFASSILLIMVLIFMEDWRERERERGIFVRKINASFLIQQIAVEECH